MKDFADAGRAPEGKGRRLASPARVLSSVASPVAVPDWMRDFSERPAVEKPPESKPDWSKDFE